MVWLTVEPEAQRADPMVNIAFARFSSSEVSRAATASISTSIGRAVAWTELRRPVRATMMFGRSILRRLADEFGC